jgi:hypothetical protein
MTVQHVLDDVAGIGHGIYGSPRHSKDATALKTQGLKSVG